MIPDRTAQVWEHRGRLFLVLGAPDEYLFNGGYVPRLYHPALDLESGRLIELPEYGVGTFEASGPHVRLA